MRKSQIAPAIMALIPLLVLLSMGCGIFVLPVSGPKSLAANAQRIHFTIEVVDEAGLPLPDVTLEIRRLSADADLIWGEVEKSESETKTVPGHFEYDSFGKYAALITITKPGYTSFALLCSNTDKLERQRSPGLFAYPHVMPNFELREVNVQKFPQQHVILSKAPPPPSK